MVVAGMEGVVAGAEGVGAKAAGVGKVAAVEMEGAEVVAHRKLAGAAAYHSHSESAQQHTRPDSEQSQADNACCIWWHTLSNELDLKEHAHKHLHCWCLQQC